MAKKETKKEEKEVIKEVVDNTTENTKAPEGKEPKGDITKVKAKMTSKPEVVDKPDIIKVDLSKKEEPKKK